MIVENKAKHRTRSLTYKNVFKEMIGYFDNGSYGLGLSDFVKEIDNIEDQLLAEWLMLIGFIEV